MPKERLKRETENPPNGTFNYISLEKPNLRTMFITQHRDKRSKSSGTSYYYSGYYYNSEGRLHYTYKRKTK